MSHREMPAQLPMDDFQLGEWSVHPQLNRLGRDQETVQIEPKMMEVLIYLALSPEIVRSKREILESVWSDVIVTESVLTRAIAGLRRALGDDTRSPTYIETIARRGYRLVAPVMRAGESRMGRLPAQRVVDENAMAVPYVVGQWVRGDRFYGREDEIAEVLRSDRRATWVLGTRRVGKTSFLRQIELITSGDPGGRVVPLYWDLQGSIDETELHQGFVDALLDAEERIASIGVPSSVFESSDLFEALRHLRRALKKRSAQLLLLCDETEELISLQTNAAALLPKLRRALLSHECVRTVLTSSSRLWTLAEQTIHTSPFLDGFLPPIYLGGLGNEDARRLAHQTQLPDASQPSIDVDSAEAISEHCGHHPYLIQLLCKRFLELGDLESAMAAVSADRTVSSLFEVDLGLLSAQEREVLHGIAAGQSVQDIAAHPSVHNLRDLGLIAERQGQLVIANSFLERWLRESG